MNPLTRASDPHVEAVRARLLSRSQVGYTKYGTDTRRGDLSVGDWIEHALDEGCDKLVYLESLRDTLRHEFDRMMVEAFGDLNDLGDNVTYHEAHDILERIDANLSALVESRGSSNCPRSTEAPEANSGGSPD